MVAVGILDAPANAGLLARGVALACTAVVALAGYGCAAEPGPPAAAAPAVDAVAAPADGSGEVTASPDGGNDAPGTSEGTSDTGSDAATVDDAGGADATAPDAASVDTGPPPSDADAGPACSPTVPPVEACDGVDNDCDGKTDQPSAGAKPLCDDGDACTVDACDTVAGKCTPPKAIACDDGKPCTDDFCAKLSGCTVAAKSGPCDDGSACTDGDACVGGACVGGEGKGCDDGNACTVDTCSAKTGCTSAPCVGTSCGKGNCSDGDACTQGDACVGGICKAGAAKCNDNNPCTTDGCAPADGACAPPVAIAGCKVCAQATNCDDKNACTTDACTSGLCVWTPVAGCIGPLDYAVLSLKPKAAKMQVPDPDDSFTFVIENLGKPPVAGMTKLTWAIVASQDTVVDAADVKLAGAVWAGAVLGAPGVTQASHVAKLGLPFNDVTLQPVLNAAITAKFVCVSLTGGGDFAPTNNNSLCTANPFVPQELKAVSVTVPGGKVTANAEVGQVSVEATNQGSEAATLSAKFFLSKDDKLDAADLALSQGQVWGLSKWGALAVGKTLAAFSDPGPIAPHDFPAGPGFLCAQVNPTLVAFEATPADNVACAAVTVGNPVDLKLNPLHIRFRSKTGVLTDSPTYGVEYGCTFTEVQNALYGEAKNVPARCFLEPVALGAAAWPGEDSWKVEWNLAEPVPAKPTLTGANGVLKGAYGLTTAPMLPKAPLQGGAIHVCATLNHDGSVDEVAGFAGNKGCRKINVLGPDLIIATTTSKIGHLKYYNPQPTTLTRGVALNLAMGLCNQGTATLGGLEKLNARILLSTDALASADDHVVYAATGIVGLTKLDPMGTYPFNCVSIIGSQSATLPLSLAAGSYQLIFDVNHDKAYAEPPGNNSYMVPVSVK